MSSLFGDKKADPGPQNLNPYNGDDLEACQAKTLAMQQQMQGYGLTAEERQHKINRIRDLVHQADDKTLAQAYKLLFP